MIDNFIAGFGSRTEHQVQDSWRYTGLCEKLNDTNAGCGCQRCGFENDGITGNECRRDLPNRNGDWKIPGSNTSNNSQRLFDGVDEVSRELRLNRLAVHAARFSCTKFRDID
jgi:hypothetical protein